MSLNNRNVSTLDQGRSAVFEPNAGMRPSYTKQRSRKMPSSSKIFSAESTPNTISIGATICPHCQMANSVENAFCTQCGGNLQGECPHCQKTVRVGNPFCGSCGKQIFDPEDEHKKKLTEALANAQELCDEGYYEEAVDFLKSLDISSEKHQAKVGEMISQTYDKYRESFQEAGHLFEKAQEAYDNKEYDAAFENLEKILPGLRNSQISKLRDEVIKLRQEIKTLETNLDPKAVKTRPIEALVDAERLLELIPEHAIAKQLSQKITSQLCHVASKRIESLKYQAAKDLLESIPANLRTEEARQLLTHASELYHIMRDVSSAAIVDPALLVLVQRWTQKASHDKRIAPLAAKIKKKLAQQKKHPELTMRPWTRSPDSPYVGFPIQWVQGFKNIDVEKENVPREFLECPAMFCTAIGLALQGMEKTVCKLNWYDAPLPGSNTKKIVLQKVGRWIARNNRSPRDMQSAWGIDLGSRCLKAVRLRWKQSEDKPTITNVINIPYDHALDLSKDPAIEAECLIGVLKEFTERTNPKRERIAVNLSGKHLLCRTVTLPPMEASQVYNSLALEARKQFHFPPEELAWNYHVLNKTTIEKREVQETVLLAGVRRAYIAQRLAMLNEVKLRVDVIQSDAIAMYNFLLHEEFNKTHIPKKKKKKKTEDSDNSNNDKESFVQQEIKSETKQADEIPEIIKTIACLDIGSDKTNALVIGTNGVLQITSLAFGIRQFNHSFRKRFDIEHEASERLVWRPETASDLHGFFEATDEVLEKFANKVGRTLQPYDGSPWTEPPEQLYLTGGGIRFHGLLSYLCHGPGRANSEPPEA